jgi:thioester reductase-like protein
MVNLVYPYEALRSANVVATRNIIDFCVAGKIKHLHYVSTDAVVPNGVKGVKEGVYAELLMVCVMV